METESILSIKNLYKKYNSKGDFVLNNINLEITRGQIIGYIGPNGAGKSTTIKILTNLVQDFEGDIEIMGMNLRLQPLEIKHRIGYVPENAALYESLTPLEYLRFIGQLYKLTEANVEVKAYELLSLFGLKNHVDQRMTSFSKGMKQKVLLISGLINNPEILFLDEPLSGLDANAVILVKEIMQQLKQQGKTIFYSSHIMDVVERISDRIIIINKGQIIADGTFDELKSKSSESSLENLFNGLTGNNQHASVAEQFIQIINA